MQCDEEEKAERCSRRPCSRAGGDASPRSSAASPARARGRAKGRQLCKARIRTMHSCNRDVEAAMRMLVPLPLPLSAAPTASSSRYRPSAVPRSRSFRPGTRKPSEKHGLALVAVELLGVAPLAEQHREAARPRRRWARRRARLGLALALGRRCGGRGGRVGRAQGRLGRLRLRARAAAERRRREARVRLVVVRVRVRVARCVGARRRGRCCRGRAGRAGGRG